MQQTIQIGPGKSTPQQTFPHLGWDKIEGGNPLAQIWLDSELLESCSVSASGACSG